MTFGLCVIGCGAFARTFAREVQGELGDMALYFASRDGGRAADFAAEFGGAGSFGSYESAVAAPEVDAVYICTPHHLHRPHARLAAAAGKQILVEKPLARDTAEAQAIVDLAADAGVTLMVAENCRFMPPVRAAKELLDRGALGTLRLAQLQEQFPFHPTGWRRDAARNGGGTLIDGGIHKFSILAYLAGIPAEIYAAEVPSATATPGVDRSSSPPPGVDNPSSPPPGVDNPSSPPPGIDRSSSPPPGVNSSSSPPPGIDRSSSLPPGVNSSSSPPPGGNIRGGEDGVVAVLRYAPPPEGNGMVGIVNHSWSAAAHTPRPWVSLAGSIASAVFELGGCWIEVIDASGRRRRELERDPTGIAAMVREFRESIAQGRAPAMTGADGARDVALVQAAYASIRTGTAVDIGAGAVSFPGSRPAAAAAHNS